VDASYSVSCEIRVNQSISHSQAKKWSSKLTGLFMTGLNQLTLN